MTARSLRNPAANWLWLPLLILVLVLFSALQKIRDDNRRALAEAESVRRQAIALKPSMRDNDKAVPAPAARSQSADARTPKSGALTFYSDDNAIADADAGMAVVRRHRRYAMANYRGPIDSLQLSPAERERLKQLIADRWIARTDASDVLQRQGEVAPELRKKMMDTVVEQANQQIRELLGDERFAELEEAYELQTHRTVNWGLFASAWDAGAPLTADEQTLVARAMVQVKAEFSSQETANEVDPASGLTRSDLALIEISTSFLTPEQVAVIRADRTAEAEYRAGLRDAKHGKQTKGDPSTP